MLHALRCLRLPQIEGLMCVSVRMTRFLDFFHRAEFRNVVFHSYLVFWTMGEVPKLGGSDCLLDVRHTLA
jgi:hypothetical protein